MHVALTFCWMYEGVCGVRGWQIQSASERDLVRHMSVAVLSFGVPSPDFVNAFLSCNSQVFGQRPFVTAPRPSQDPGFPISSRIGQRIHEPDSQSHDIGDLGRGCTDLSILGCGL